MTTVGMHEAKTNLSKLVDEALAGNEVVITRRGEPVVRLEPVRQQKRSFADALGIWPDIWIADDFDELPEDMARALGMID
jgi:prevent-host-death family protein